MNIGNKIRARRREKDMTQESLAEILGVSVSAVSLWESEKTMPDIALIPAICSVLGISADELFGIHVERKKEEIEKIIAEARKLGDPGYTEEALQVITQGLRAYPDSYNLLHHALWYHHRLATGADGEDERKKHKDAAIGIGERILENCTELSFRCSAIQRLCFLYRDDNPKRAEELLDEMANLHVSREVLGTHIYKGTKQIEAMQHLTTSTLDIMTNRMLQNGKDDGGNRRYTREEAARVHEKVLAIYHTVFEDGDFGFYHTRLWDSEMALAEYHAVQKDAEKTMDHLRNAADHAIGFVKFAAYGENEYVHTSLVLRGKKSGVFSTTAPENDALCVRKHLDEAQYDFIRDTKEFRDIAASLDEYAGCWKPKE